jgi:putative transposase
MRSPFRYFNSSPEVIRLTVMMYIWYPLSLRQVEDSLLERGIDIKQNRSTTLAEWRQLAA